MPPAVAAAGIAAAATIGGAVISSSSQKKAAKQASDAELKMAQQNNALAREFRAENTANFQPYLQSGNRANSLIDSFLYASPQSSTVRTLPERPELRIGAAQPDSQWAEGALQAMGLGSRGNPLATLQGHLAGQIEGQLPTGVRQAYDNYVRANPQGGGYSAPATAGPASSPLSGYQAFEASPYYQFPLQEGMRQLNTGLASRGQIKSGDAMKSAIRYGQDYGYGRMGEFIGLAENQANRGVQSAGAIAGVGVNALNSMANSNTAAGNAMANNALARGAANGQMWAGIGSAVGTAAGSLLGPQQSSYAAPVAPFASPSWTNFMGGG